MEKETKKYLIIGTALVVSIGIAVVIWKKYQTSNTASSAASDQSNQDELALLESSLEANAYAGQAGAASYSPAVVGTGTPTSLADEITALETALGFGPPATAANPLPTATGAPAPTPTPAPTPVASPTPAPAAPIETAGNNPATVADAIRYQHGSPIFEAEGVPGEGVMLS
jgi:hypothetical protein